jgi:hemerythrin-like metal-binding protein
MSYPTDELPWRLEWNEGLSMHIPELDAEHRRFIRLVNDLNEAIAGRMEVAEVRKRMRAILDDAAAHFAHEEVLFREWGYPEADEHALKHVQIMSALHGIMANFERGGTEYEWIEAGLQIKQVLVEHLLSEDMKYRDYRSMLETEPAKGEASGPAR